ncbi:MAG: Tfx family DNA-binding protein [Hadesarchaea archaeon]|nr:Tfx family DNA-binding protein [Hadesarchaea archaeon]
MVNIKDTHLTKRQFEVLKMRREGRTLAEIAARVRTSRSNVSAILKTAEENVNKAKNTLKLVAAIKWPIKIDVRAGSNIYEVSERVFSEADKKRIKVSHNYSEVVRLITETLGWENLKRRKALREFTVMVSKEGMVEVL